MKNDKEENYDDTQDKENDYYQEVMKEPDKARIKLGFHP